MPVTKILVNFKTKKAIHFGEHRGSNEYLALIKEGYVEVGSIKTIYEPKVFWNPDYFEPKAKYSPKNK